jgi:hypothetical protein
MLSRVRTLQALVRVSKYTYIVDCDAKLRVASRCRAFIKWLLQNSKTNQSKGPNIKSPYLVLWKIFQFFKSCLELKNEGEVDRQMDGNNKRDFICLLDAWWISACSRVMDKTDNSKNLYWIYGILPKFYLSIKYLFFM